jgi:hypothetical protein
MIIRINPRTKVSLLLANEYFPFKYGYFMDNLKYAYDMFPSFIYRKLKSTKIMNDPIISECVQKTKKPFNPKASYYLVSPVFYRNSKEYANSIRQTFKAAGVLVSPKPLKNTNACRLKNKKRSLYLCFLC